MNIYGVTGFLLSTFSAGYWAPWATVGATASGTHAHESCQGAGAAVVLAVTPVNVAQTTVKATPPKSGSAAARIDQQVDSAIDVELDVTWYDEDGVDTVVEWYVGTDTGELVSRLSPEPHRLRDQGLKGTIPATVDVSTLPDGYYHLTAALAVAATSGSSIETTEQTLYFGKLSGRVDFYTFDEWSKVSDVSRGTLQVSPVGEPLESEGGEPEQAQEARTTIVVEEEL